jgi:cyclic pyranopterin phosphate synthase
MKPVGQIENHGKYQPAGRRLIEYLRISVTDRCNLRCHYCMPAAGVRYRPHAEILSYEEITDFTRAAADLGITSVRLTGGEPLLRRGCTRLVEMLAGIDGIDDLSMTTNGFFLPELASDLRAARLGRVNISLDSLNPERFATITGAANLARAMAGIDAALEAGLAPVKINAVMLRGIEDEAEDFLKLAAERPLHVRFIERMPIGGSARPQEGIVTVQELQRRLGEFVKLKPVASPGGSGPARYFGFKGALGTIGFIGSMTGHFCGSCNRMRLTADGRLRSCLFSADETYVRPLIGGDQALLKQALSAEMAAKRFDRSAEDPGARSMAQIGG